jgi:hypothetical protein
MFNLVREHNTLLQDSTLTFLAGWFANYYIFNLKIATAMFSEMFDNSQHFTQLISKEKVLHYQYVKYSYPNHNSTLLSNVTKLL